MWSLMNLRQAYPGSKLCVICFRKMDIFIENVIISYHVTTAVSLES